jgi:hypothetical protein
MPHDSRPPWLRPIEYVEDRFEPAAAGQVPGLPSNGNYDPADHDDERHGHDVEELLHRPDRRDEREYEHDGMRLALGDWAELSGIPYRTLKNRIRHVWTIVRAITEPVKAMVTNG